MESIDILTGQNVTIQYEPANIVRRMSALLLDYFFMGVYFFVLFYAYSELMPFRSFDYNLEIVVLGIVLLLPVMGYHFIFESTMGGRTPGKIIAKIKVANLDGSTPRLIDYFLRWILLPVDMFPIGGVGSLFILFSENHQRLGDLAAGTTVVRTESISPLSLDEYFYEFDDDYQPAFNEVNLLTDGQILFISNLLQDPKNKNIMDYTAIELAGKVKKKLNIQSDMDDLLFLETIVRDYNYYASLGV